MRCETEKRELIVLRECSENVLYIFFLPMEKAERNSNDKRREFFCLKFKGGSELERTRATVPTTNNLLSEIN